MTQNHFKIQQPIFHWVFSQTDFKNHRLNHQPSEFGIGAFIQESVPTGTILRKGCPNTNLIIAKSKHDFPKLTEATLYYIQNFCSTVDFYEATVELEVGKNKNREKSVENQEMFFWVPGNSTNHSENNSNVVHLKSVDGYDAVASRDILKGEELTGNYGSFGKPPRWYEEFLEEVGIDQCMFKGYNDYVNWILYWENEENSQENLQRKQ